MQTEFEKDIEVAQGRLRDLFQYVRDNTEADSTRDIGAAAAAAAAAAKKGASEYPKVRAGAARRGFLVSSTIVGWTLDMLKKKSMFHTEKLDKENTFKKTKNTCRQDT